MVHMSDQTKTTPDEIETLVANLISEAAHNMVMLLPKEGQTAFVEDRLWLLFRKISPCLKMLP